MTSAYNQYLEAIRRNLESPTFVELPDIDKYQLLYDLYVADGFYVFNLSSTIEQEKAAIRSLRNPVKRLCNFYADTLWPDPTPIFDGDVERVYPYVQQVWSAAKWSTQKQKIARYWPLFGNMFLYCGPNSQTGVWYPKWLDPRYVLDYDLDDTGNLSYCRIGYEASKRDPKTGVEEAYKHLEVWYQDGSYKVWQLKKDRNLYEPLDRYGNPIALGNIGYIPIFHAPFSDSDDKKGLSVLAGVLDKIFELDKQATLAGARMYRYGRPVMALETSGYDPMGRPLPAPNVDRDNNIALDELLLDREKIYRLPSGSKISYLTAPLDYHAALNLINAQIADLENDLPELQYSEISKQSGENSAISLRLKLIPAIARAKEARNRGELPVYEAFKFCMMMNGLEGAMSETFSFRQPDIIQRSEDEAIMLASQLKALGWTDDQAMTKVGLNFDENIVRMKP